MRGLEAFSRDNHAVPRLRIVAALFVCSSVEDARSTRTAGHPSGCQEEICPRLEFQVDAFFNMASWNGRWISLLFHDRWCPDEDHLRLVGLFSDDPGGGEEKHLLRRRNLGRPKADCSNLASELMLASGQGICLESAPRHATSDFIALHGTRALLDLAVFRKMPVILIHFSS